MAHFVFEPGPVISKAVMPQQAPALAIDHTLQQAFDYCQCGRLQDAERLYRAILQVQPNHPDANHNLGVIAMGERQPVEALALIKTALDANPNQGQYWLSYADAHFNLGAALQDLGHHIEAKANFRRALLIKPDFAEAHYNLGVVFKDIYQLDKAELSFRRAHQIMTDFVEAHANLGNTLNEMGRLDEAVVSFRSALRINPNSTETLSNLGNTLQELGRLDEAEISYRRALQIKPDYAEAHYNLGITLQKLGRLTESETSFRQAIQIKSDYPEAHSNLGSTLQALGRLDEAEIAFRRAFQITPDYAEAHYNLGVTLQKLGRLDEGAVSYRQALQLKPDFTDARINLGGILHQIVGKYSGKEFVEEKKQSLQGVRRQYECLPFPPRDPEAERYIMSVSIPDILGKVNQYCFSGSRDFSAGFRVLVAGCGTGDSAIWIAHQLKDTRAEIVAIDISETSLAVAQARARMRNLNNIQWVNGSLLDLSALGLGRFDYITCLGVLHHLPDPEAGLIALESVLADGGAMAIMLYGAVGRSHIYSMQDILRRLSVGLDTPGERLAFAKKVVANLPATNGFRRQAGMNTIDSVFLQDDTTFWDTLLHEQDRAYTASQVRNFLASAGLILQAFTSYQGVEAIAGLQYDLDLYIEEAWQKEQLKKLSLPQREDLAEALDGGLALHTVYATRSVRSSLRPTASGAILSPMSHSAQQIIAYLMKPDQAISIVLSNGMVLPYKPSVLTKRFLAHVDGHLSNAEITRILGIKEGSEEIDLVTKELVIPTALHWLIARTSAGSYLPPLVDKLNLSFPMRHFEPVTLPL